MPRIKLIFALAIACLVMFGGDRCVDAWQNDSAIGRGLLAGNGLTKPNVVLIVVDDLGWMDLGCYGSSFYETPNLDAFAKTGVRFTCAYATCPVCSPTRVSIMTGRYPQRNGLTDYAGAAQPENWKRDSPLLPAAYREVLALEETTIAEVFHEAGYATFFAGKWHLGGPEFYPQHQGFDINVGGCQWGHPRGGKHFFSPYDNPSMPDGPVGEYLPERMADETMKFIRDHNDEPFLAVLSFYVVHTPLMTTSDLEGKYNEKKSTMEFAEPLFVECDGRKVRQVQEHAVYAGMVEAMDTACGKVLDSLDELGIADNTLVIFTSDNGGLSTSEGHPTSNLPLRAGKGWLYEGGIRVPLIVRAPGHVGVAGSVSDVPVNSNDFLPTAVQFADLNSAAMDAIDGESLLPILSGKVDVNPRPLFWHYPHYGNQGGSPGQAVRHRNWKLIRFFGNDRQQDVFELYDLVNDIGENQNLIDAQSVVARELASMLDEWSRDVGAKYPSAR